MSVKPSPHAPEVVAMVLADLVHRDPGTSKHYILGTYNGVFAPRFPYSWPLMQVYAALTDGRGRVPVRLVLTDADEELGALSVAEGSVEMADPTRNTEVVFSLRDVVLPQPGHYRLQLLACGQPAARTAVLGEADGRQGSRQRRRPAGPHRRIAAGACPRLSVPRG